jgi:hypothetical protein
MVLWRYPDEPWRPRSLLSCDETRRRSRRSFRWRTNDLSQRR